MDPNNSLQSSFWTMIVLQTLGSMDMPGRGPRKMPAPRSYGAIIVAWGVLQLIVDAGSEGAARAARTMGWVMVFAGMVVGPFGKALASLFTKVADTLAPSYTQPLAEPAPTQSVPYP